MSYRTKCLRCDMDISSKADICPYCRNDPNQTSLSANMTDGERLGVQSAIDEMKKNQPRWGIKGLLKSLVGLAIVLIAANWLRDAVPDFLNSPSGAGIVLLVVFLAWAFTS